MKPLSSNLDSLSPPGSARRNSHGVCPTEPESALAMGYDMLHLAVDTDSGDEYSANEPTLQAMKATAQNYPDLWVVSG